MKTHQTDFSQGSIYRNIMEVAVPMTVAQLLNLLYNIVDRMYIGRIPEVGTLALTGVGLCFPIITLVSAFTLLFVMAEVLFVPWSGDGEMKRKRNTLWEIPS